MPQEIVISIGSLIFGLLSIIWVEVRAGNKKTASLSEKISSFSAKLEGTEKVIDRLPCVSIPQCNTFKPSHPNH